MATCTHDFVERNATQEVDGDESSSPCVTADELVFGDSFGLNQSGYLGFTFNFFGQSHGFHQMFKVLII